MVVDREVQVLPAGAAITGQPVAVDPLADRPEAAELLGVDVQQLAGPCALVAPHRLTAGRANRETPCTAQHLPDGRSWQTELASDQRRARLGVLAPARISLLEPRGCSCAAAASASTDDQQARPSRLPGSDAKADSRSHDSRRKRPRPAADSSHRRSTPRADSATRTRNASACGGQTRSCIWASCASWVLVDHKARRRPGRNQPSRRCVGNRTRPPRRRRPRPCRTAPARFGGPG